LSFNTGCTSNHCGNAYAGAAPSRTAVDSDGNVYVANRHFDGGRPSIVKILANDYVDRNGNGVLDTSTDANNDGVVTYDEMITLNDLNNNDLLDPNELADERVAWITYAPAGTAGGLGRSLSIDGDGDLYFGMYNQQRYYKFRGTDGAVLGGPFNTPNHTPYGSIIDGDGILWGASLTNNLLKFNTNTNTVLNTFTHSGSNYGIAIAPDNTNTLAVYLANYSGLCWAKFNTVTNTFTYGNGCSSYGVATDGAGNYFVGNANGGMRRFANDGTPVCQGAAQPGTGEVRGAVVDSDNNLWLIHRTSGNLSKYNGTNCAALGVFPSGDQPYTYTDATGIQRFTTTQPQGTFTAILDSGSANQVWRRVFWNTEPQGAVPANTSITVEARAATSQAALAGQAFLPVTNNADLCLAGRVIEVRSTLATSVTGTTPVLSDLSVVGKCDINGDGAVNTLDITAITNARNSSASGVCDARDLDGSGRIDVNDARQCALKCTKPNCAI
jgi:hypothetical protein